MIQDASTNTDLLYFQSGQRIIRAISNKELSNGENDPIPLPFRDYSSATIVIDDLGQPMYILGTNDEDTIIIGSDGIPVILRNFELNSYMPIDLNFQNGQPLLGVGQRTWTSDLPPANPFWLEVYAHDLQLPRSVFGQLRSVIAEGYRRESSTRTTSVGMQLPDGSPISLRLASTLIDLGEIDPTYTGLFQSTLGRRPYNEIWSGPSFYGPIHYDTQPRTIDSRRHPFRPNAATVTNALGANIEGENVPVEEILGSVLVTVPDIIDPTRGSRILVPLEFTTDESNAVYVNGAPMGLLVSSEVYGDSRDPDQADMIADSDGSTIFEKVEDGLLITNIPASVMEYINRLGQIEDFLQIGTGDISIFKDPRGNMYAKTLNGTEFYRIDFDEQGNFFQFSRHSGSSTSFSKIFNLRHFQGEREVAYEVSGAEEDSPQVVAVSTNGNRYLVDASDPQNRNIFRRNLSLGQVRNLKCTEEGMCLVESINNGEIQVSIIDKNGQIKAISARLPLDHEVMVMDISKVTRSINGRDVTESIFTIVYRTPNGVFIETGNLKDIFLPMIQIGGNNNHQVDLGPAIISAKDRSRPSGRPPRQQGFA